MDSKKDSKRPGPQTEVCSLPVLFALPGEPGDHSDLQPILKNTYLVNID